MFGLFKKKMHLYDRLEFLKEQYQNIPNLILSFPRCGRTWVRYVLGHYIAKKYNVDFIGLDDRPRPGIPRILFRHDFMSAAGRISWEKFFQIQDSKQFIFKEEMKKQNIIYLFRNPLDVLFSYWSFLQSIPYENFVAPKHSDIIDFAKNKQWGFDIIINFMNTQLDHFKQHKNSKLLVKYEDLKKQDTEWQKLIEFIFRDFNEKSFAYAKEQTTFKKMQEKNDAEDSELVKSLIQSNKDVPDELKFYRKGGSNYINDLPKDQQDILLNWPGYKDLNKRICER